jgi:hypothetical protein
MAWPGLAWPGLADMKIRIFKYFGNPWLRRPGISCSIECIDYFQVSGCHFSHFVFVEALIIIDGANDVSIIKF